MNPEYHVCYVDKDLGIGLFCGKGGGMYTKHTRRGAAKLSLTTSPSFYHFTH